MDLPADQCRLMAESYCFRAVSTNNLEEAEKLWQIAQSWIKLAHKIEEGVKVKPNDVPLRPPLGSLLSRGRDALRAR